jgi:hypothetical protein
MLNSSSSSIISHENLSDIPSIEIDDIVGYVHRLVHSITFEDHFLCLSFIVEYLREEFLPPIVLPLLQSFLLHPNPFSDSLLDLIFTVVGYLGEFFDSKSDFSYIFSILLTSYPLPSSIFGLHSLLKSQFSVAQTFFPHFNEFSEIHSLSSTDFCQFLVSFSCHKTLIPDLICFLPIVIEFLNEDDEELGRQTFTFLRHLTKHEIGRNALFSAANSAQIFRFGKFEIPTLKLILLLTFYEPGNTLKVLIQSDSLEKLTKILRKGILEIDCLSIEICRYLTAESIGIQFLNEMGFLELFESIEMDVGFEKWVNVVKVICEVICKSSIEIMSRFGIEKLLKSLELILVSDEIHDRSLFLQTIEIIVIEIERQGKEKFDKIFGETELFEILFELQESEPIAKFICQKLTS